MSAVKPLKKLVSCVILDLDGTLLNTGEAVFPEIIISFFCFSLLKLNGCTRLQFTFNLIADGIVSEVLKVFLVKYGKQWNGKTTHKLIGKTPFEASAVIVEDYELPCTTEELISEITPMFSDQ